MVENGRNLPIGIGLTEGPDAFDDSLQQAGRSPAREGHGIGIDGISRPPNLDPDIRVTPSEGNISDQ